MLELNDDNFLIFAIQHYDSPGCIGMADIEEDLQRFKYLKRLFRKYHTTKVLSERLILNHIIVLYNVFGEEATIMLLYKINKNYWNYLKTFLLYLNRMSPDDLPEISVDLNIANTLRKING
jgi:hypothetical protein